jgi:hypothetical protein
MAVMAVLACTAKKEAVKATPTPTPAATVEPIEAKPTKTPKVVLSQETKATIEKMVAFYAVKYPGQDASLVRFAGEETARFVKMVNDTRKPGTKPVELTDLLALWWVESRYTQNTEGEDGKSWGITQVRLNRINELTDAWKLYGINREDGLGSVYDPTRQVAMGVMAYRIAFGEARGDRFQALRRYNGGNKGKKSKAYKSAHAHAMRVIKARKAIFGQ